MLWKLGVNKKKTIEEKKSHPKWKNSFDDCIWTKNYTLKREYKFNYS